MRYWISLLIVLLVFVGVSFAESYRKTTEDMYRESYMAAMRRQTGQSIPDMRAEEYRRIYEICDEHHNCTSVTARAERKAREKQELEKSRTLEAKPFFHVPYWM